MKKDDIRKIMEKLLAEIEEEDIGIGLFSTFCQNQEELHFFCGEDGSRVLQILGKLSEDSKRHKEILEKIINSLGERLHEK